MTDYGVSAFYKVRKWIISELYSNGILSESNYVNSSPIIPIQQVPESNDNRDWGEAGFPADAPFIVYDFLVPGSYDTDYWNRRDEIIFWIYDYDIEKLIEIKEFMVDLMGRLDDSATDINEFEDLDSPFTYQYFDVMMGLPTDEIDKVLGRYGVNLVICYQYTRPLNSRGRFA